MLNKEDLQIAQTIHEQIGLDTWLAVGGRDRRAYIDEDGNVVNQFRFGSRYGLPKYIDITYKRGRDDYHVHGYKIHRNKAVSTFIHASEHIDGKEFTNYDGVYADQLPDLVRVINVVSELS